MIKNIVFDFGDVFINLDKEATFDQLRALGVTNFSIEMIEVAKPVSYTHLTLPTNREV